MNIENLSQIKLGSGISYEEAVKILGADFIINNKAVARCLIVFLHYKPGGSIERMVPRKTICKECPVAEACNLRVV